MRFHQLPAPLLALVAAPLVHGFYLPGMFGTIATYVNIGPALTGYSLQVSHQPTTKMAISYPSQSTT